MSRGNPERDWGRPGWSTGPGNGKNPKTVRDSQDGKGCRMMALLLLVVLSLPAVAGFTGLGVWLFA